MLLNLRKGESRRHDEGYEVQLLTVGPQGGERWETLNVGTSTKTGTQLPLEEAREIASRFKAGRHVRFGRTGWDADGVRIVRTLLESEVVDEHRHA